MDRSTRIETPKLTGSDLLGDISLTSLTPGEFEMVRAKASGLVILMCVINLLFASMALANDIVVDENGNVGIGITSPSEKLHVNGNVKTGNLILGPWPYSQGYLFLGSSQLDQTQVGNYFLLQHPTDGRSYLNSPLDIRFRINNLDKMTISNSGNVGIGTASPDPNYKLDVNGNIRAVSWASDSDLRWKENVNPIEDSLERVSQLRGVTYEWIDKSKGEGQQLGVIAQEVEEVFPQVVHTDSQGYKSVEYSKLVAPLIESVKELKAQNEALKTQLIFETDMLKREIEALKQMIAGSK